VRCRLELGDDLVEELEVACAVSGLLTRDASATTTLSASSCRMSRPGPAPRAARTASSGRFASPRISNRFATFALAMSSTSPTAPNSTSMAVRTSPTTTSA
jgi:hypothetical protein